MLRRYQIDNWSLLWIAAQPKFVFLLLEEPCRQSKHWFSRQDRCDQLRHRGRSLQPALAFARSDTLNLLDRNVREHKWGLLWHSRLIFPSVVILKRQYSENLAQRSCVSFLLGTLFPEYRLESCLKDAVTAQSNPRWADMHRVGNILVTNFLPLYLQYHANQMTNDKLLL